MKPPVPVISKVNVLAKLEESNCHGDQSLCVCASTDDPPSRLMITCSTGVTGYIAGDAVFAINEAHPSIDFTFLVRTEDKAAIVRKAYPRSRVIIGELDHYDLIEEEAARADIVLRTLVSTK